MARLVAERRDLVARAARDRLANMLGLHPRDVGSLDTHVAEAMTDHLNRVNRRIQQLVDQAAADELTGALRREAGVAALEREVQRARRFADRRLVVAFVDVDGLKAVNDGRGHPAGDRLLSEIGRSLRARLRAYDLVIRWGGDEFVCVLPEAGLKAARKAMDQIARDFTSRTGSTFSVGLVEIGDEETGQDMVSRADAELLASRRDERSEPAAPPPRRVAAGLIGAATVMVAALGMDLALATPGSLWWLPHGLADRAQVRLSRNPGQAELDLAQSRLEAAAAKPPGPARQAWLANARLHLDAAIREGADPAGVEKVRSEVSAATS